MGEGSWCIVSLNSVSKVYLAQFLTKAGVRYVRRCIKNCVKVLIGRKAYFSHDDIFFRLFVLQLIGGRQIRSVTCCNDPEEGPGSQALQVMRTLCFAQACGLTYVHTPFCDIAHADRPIDEWVGAWEMEFNFGAGEVQAGNSESEILQFPLRGESLRLFGIEDLRHTFHATVPKFRCKYYLNKSPRMNEIITVCVHIRRGDVTENGYYKSRWVHTAVIARTVSKIKLILDSLSLEYTVAGCRPDFVDLIGLTLSKLVASLAF
jgi:hypothetical protein